MKFTSKQLAGTLGVKIGDKIKVSDMVYEVTRDYVLKDDENYYWGLFLLIDEEYEIVKPKKKVGDTICREICCYNCPLKMLDCPDNNNRTLFEKLEMVHEEYNDKEIYDILKARLDKEVE